MTISPTVRTQNAVTLLNTTGSTASFTTPNNALCTVVIRACMTSLTPPATFGLTGQSLTWTLVQKVEAFYAGGGLTPRNHCLYVFQALNNTGGDQTGAVTVTSATQIRTIGYQFVTWEDSGGQTVEIVQSNKNNGTGTGLSVSLSAFADATNNVAYGGFGTGGNNNSAISKEAGHTLVGATQDNGSLDSDERGNELSSYQVGQDTSLTATGNGDNWAAIALELGLVSSGVTGTMTAKMQTLKSVASGAQTQTGSITAKLQALKAVLAGVMQPSGTIASKLQVAQMTATGNAGAVSGAIAATLQSPVMSSSGAQTISGSITTKLAVLAAALAGYMQPDGIVAVKLQPMSAAFTGVEVPSGTIQAALQALTFEGAGTPEVSGTLSAQIQSLVMAASGAMVPTGTIAAAIQPLVMSGVGEQTATGVITAVLQSLIMDATGDQTLTGSLVAKLQPLVMAATAALLHPPIGNLKELVPPSSRMQVMPINRVSPAKSRLVIDRPSGRVIPPNSRL